MTVKDAMGDFGWESSYPDEVVGWMRASTDVSDAIICTDTAEAFDWVMDAFNARVENFTAKTCRDGEKGFIFLSPAARRSEGRKGLLKLRLGIWPDIASLLEEHGYQIVPRTETMKGDERHALRAGVHRGARALCFAVLYEQWRRADRL